jgi:tRNA pseudouridine38-40 synthase
MPKWKLLIEYDGTRYRGWQEQLNARTIQGELRKAAEDYFQKQVEITGSGRTDAGVHALYQIAHLQSSKAATATALKQAINDRLPGDINIRRVDETLIRFHARHHAEERFYLYQIATQRTAFGKHFVWWIKDRLDVPQMKAAAKHFVGLHDFSLYREKEKKAPDPRVDVTCCELATQDDLILLRIGASHFLWKMVRRLVGVLVEIGRGNLAIHQIKNLTHEDIARWTAPPSGLFLEYVRYPGDPAPSPIRPAITFR